MVAKQEKAPMKRLEIEIPVGRRIHLVTLESSADPRVRLEAEGLVDVGPKEREGISSEIIRLCDLGYEARKLGLTKEDMGRMERHFIIKPT